MHIFSGLRTITRRIVANIDIKQHSFGLHLMQNLKRLNLVHVITVWTPVGPFLEFEGCWFPFTCMENNYKPLCTTKKNHTKNRFETT